MPLTQQGAIYERRAHIKDQHALAAFDDLASQIAAVRNQGNFGKDGVIEPPHAPTLLLVTVQAGIYTATITHSEAPAGTNWRLEYSRTPDFKSPIKIDLGDSPNWENYLPNQKLYFRVAAKFLASQPSPFVYFGSSANPTAV